MKWLRPAMFEIRARELAKGLGAKIRRDNRNRRIVVTHRGEQRTFPEGNWAQVVDYLKRIRRDGM